MSNNQNYQAPPGAFQPVHNTLTYVQRSQNNKRTPLQEPDLRLLYHIENQPPNINQEHILNLNHEIPRMSNMPQVE